MTLKIVLILLSLTQSLLVLLILLFQNMEYVLYVSYPIVGELTLAAVAGNMFSWPVAPFFCIVFG